FDSFDLLEELAKEKLIDGAEVYHSSADESYRNELSQLCEQYNLIQTGGSDFHGFYNHYPIQIGSATTAEDQLEKILNFNS
ncbi:MAG: PHP domain-containing protein, partial [Oscillospiraceae bacterium]